MNNVIIYRGQGGLGRQPLGQDYISGLVLYGAAPVSFPTGGIAIFGGISDAIAAGITNDYSDETAAQLESAITLGSPGDVISVYFLDPYGNNVLLGTYTQQSALIDTTSTLLAGNIATAINTNSHNNGGYTATNVISHTASANLVVTMRPGLGVFPGNNSGNLTAVIVTSTTLAFGTPSVLVTGVASVLYTWYYHISRFFTQSPNATLYVGIFNKILTSSYAFPEVGSMQAFANGAIRQLGIYAPLAYTGMPQIQSFITAIEAQIRTQIGYNAPLSAILGTDISAGGNSVADLRDVSLFDSEHVSISIGQDGNATGFGIFSAQNFSVTQVGDILGLVSSSQVSDDIAWVATYTLSPDGIENAVPAFGTGELLSILSQGTIDSLDAFRYIFGRQFVNNSPNGTFVNDSHCATSYTSDYAYIENNRTFDKASRQLYAAYVAQLAAPLVLNADGTLTNNTVAFFEGLGEQALSNMAQTNPNTGRPELSGFSVFINPAQNVLSNSTLVVSVTLQPIGVAREIVLNLQFAVSL